jgi:ATP-dependent helicase/DNAse subunit B
MGLQAAADDGRQMIPAYFELGFGMKDDDGDPHSIPDHVELLRPESSEENPEKLLIRGRIDRVDLAADGTAIAYDYKLSRGAGLDDLREGRDLQIGIYLTALEQLFLRGQRIAGGGYYVLQGKLDRRNRGLYRASLVEYTKLGRGVGANLPEEKWLEARREMVARIWEFSDAMKVGRFRVKPSAPKESCPRCDYSAVCRYEPFRIRAKESS